MVVSVWLTKALVENQTGMKIKTLQSDNGGEFVSKKLDDFLHECVLETT
jgi:hypothetical protein